jgi:predicted phosphoribosyltransferase
MEAEVQMNIYDFPELRDRIEVFRDRIHAGQVLAEMLSAFDQKGSIVLGIPAGGVPVAAEIAKKLGLTFDVAVVSKITLPWNTEAGYGAVAFDGTHRLNEEMLPRLGLTPKEIQTGIEKTTAKVLQRVVSLRGEKPLPELSQKRAIVVDDGLASGFTMLVAVEALSKAGAEHIIVAVPTGHSGTVEKIATKVKALYCPNIRGGWRFAVADAYEKWSDVKNEEVSEIMKKQKI